MGDRYLTIVNTISVGVGLGVRVGVGVRVSVAVAVAVRVGVGVSVAGCKIAPAQPVRTLMHVSVITVNKCRIKRYGTQDRGEGKSVFLSGATGVE